jgi:hypothetical protein
MRGCRNYLLCLYLPGEETEMMEALCTGKWVILQYLLAAAGDEVKS